MPGEKEPLVGGAIEVKGATSWPVDPGVPVPERSKNCFCKWICCIVPFAAVGYVFGAAALVAAAILALLLWVLCCGTCVCGVFAWMYSWDWAGNLYLKILYIVYQQSLFSRAETPGTGPKEMPVSGIKPLPPPPGELQKYQVHYALNIKVPKGSEEEFTGEQAEASGASKLLEEAMAKYLPHDPDFTEFAENENPVEYLMNRIGTVYPVLYQVWSDKQSDVALTRFAMNGLGAHRLDVENVDGVKYFVVRTNQLSALPVKAGYERYGGDAYFDKNWRPAFIKDMGLAAPRRDGPVDPVVTRPGEPGWDRAKFRFRSSLSVLVTFVDHLYGIHLEASNCFVTSMRENLSPDHPMRRFLAPFTYMAITVNDNAHFNLIAPGSFVDRCFAFNQVAVQQGFAMAKELIHRGVEGETGPFLHKEKYYEYMKSKGIDTAYLKFSAKYWRCIKDFVDAYTDCYYASAEAMAADAELVSFTRQVFYQSIASTLRSQAPIAGSAVQSAADFKEKVLELMTAYIWEVTAGHEQVGSVGVYTQDVSFCAFKWTAGKTVGTKQCALAQGLLMSFTSMPMPALMGGNWTHLFPETKGKGTPGSKAPKDCFDKFQADLQVLSEEVQTYNKTCDQRSFPQNFPMYVLDPALMETSVSV